MGQIKRTRSTVQSISDPKYQRYDKFVGVCIIQLLIGLIGTVIGAYIFINECKNEYGTYDSKCVKKQRTTAIAAMALNTLVVIISILGIWGAVLELPLAFSRQDKLLDVLRLDHKYKTAKKYQQIHVWLSLLMSLVCFVVCFVYLHDLFNNQMKSTGHSDHEHSDKFFAAVYVVLVFYFVEFILFNATAVANRAIIVASVAKGYDAVTKEHSDKQEAMALEMKKEFYGEAV